MTEINPTDIRYIKLGPGGAWVPTCIETGEIHFGYSGEPFEQAERGDWDGAVAHYVATGRSLAKARDAVRELHDFFTLGADSLWITFADQHLWWAFAEPGVDVSASPMAGRAACRRRTIGGWRKTNVRGGALRIDALSSRLTQVAAYRQTICSVKASDYLLRRINATPEPVVLAATQARRASVTAARAMIEQLH